jgi:hypothetical protein
MIKSIFRQGLFGTACVLLVAATIPCSLSAQREVNRNATVKVRVVVPVDLPAFDPAVTRRHKDAVVPQALVFPEAPGEEGEALILLNPRHAVLPTYLSALSLLEESLSEGGKEIRLFTRPIKNLGREDSSARARELNALLRSGRQKLPGPVGSGRMIEVDLTYATRGD